jgi:DNA-binding transcriptional MerR regulator
MVQGRLEIYRMDDQTLTIGQLAKAAGVPTSAVRFYERQKLLLADTRSHGNYRLYGLAALERLRFIRAAQAAGFTLKDIATLTRMEDSADDDCQSVRGLVEVRLTEVIEQIAHLEHAREVLKQWQAECRRAERAGRCPMLRGLHREAESKSSPPGGRRAGKAPLH